MMETLRNKNSSGLAIAIIIGIATATACPSRAPAATNDGATETRTTSVLAEIERILSPANEQEKAVLADVSDGSAGLEPAFAYLLKKAATLGQLSPDQLARLDRPSAAGLVRRPDLWRYRPLRLSVRVHFVRKIADVRGLGISSPWPADRPVWRLECTSADDASGDQPAMIVFTPFEPTGLGAGRVDAEHADRGVRYSTRRVQELVGLFYKYQSLETLAGPVAPCPVLVVWQMVAADNDAKNSGVVAAARSILIAMLIMVGAVAFLMLKRHVKRLRHLDRRKAYVSHRNVADRDEDESVDPQLRAAAQKYRRQRQSDVETDNKD